MKVKEEEEIPAPGQWPVEPQADQPISADRIWIDGCFDFVHHGHAGAMLQAKQLGTELLVGIHSDEAILYNKGPTVMTLDERIAAVEACRWADRAIPHAPYVTSLPWVSHYGCKYVVHGDDITTDSTGQDTYRYVKEAGRFLEVKRTPGISTTDLVGRMLLFSKSHFIKDIAVALDGGESGYSETAQQMRQRMRDYATDASGKKAWVQVSYYSTTAKSFTTLIEGITPYPSQRVIYVDGSFDLFSSGHIEFLKAVVAEETARGKSTGWFSAENTHHRIAETGIDYAPLYLVLGLHSDYAVNTEKGANYPIMNIYERTLCTLQCKYINALILNAPFTPAASYLHFLPAGRIAAIYHGPHATLENPEGEGNRDPYAAAKEMGLCILMVGHGYADVNAKSIVKRILENRALYEERQRKKGVKMVREKGMVESGH